MTLVNATFKWIEDNLKDKIDFVIWTGDSARHDSDEHRPREEDEVVQSNRLIVEKFVEVFGKPDNIGNDDPTDDFVVPIVPTYGNNDILPHNIFKPGSNRWTKRYLQIWEKFIPEAQRHTFDRGGWFFVEVIPNKLAVFSLNTLYLFDSNAAVDGCNKKSQPGYEHMEWLRIQLQLLRKRGMKAIMIGHVPPARTESKQSWDESCWQKYTLWMKQYRDVVVGGAYGHMNIDHFMLQDSEGLEKYYTNGEVQDQNEELSISGNNPTKWESMFNIRAGANYLLSLREEWSGLPKLPSFRSEQELESMQKDKKSKDDKQKKLLDAIGGEWAERFSLSLVSPSVVPNYFPTLRVTHYNISNLADSVVGPGLSEPKDFYFTSCDGSDMVSDDENVLENGPKTSKKKHKKKDKKKPKFKVPKAPSESSPPGPAYSPQALTWLSYTQYFANLTHINNDSMGTKSEPRPFKYEVEYDTKTDERYKLDDLTVRSYLDLALRIGEKGKAEKSIIETVEDEEGEERDIIAEGADQDDNPQDPQNGDEMDISKHKKKNKKHKHKKKKGHEINKLWETFVQRAFVGTKTEHEIEESFS